MPLQENKNLFKNGKSAFATWMAIARGFNTIKSLTENSDRSRRKISKNVSELLKRGYISKTKHNKDGRLNLLEPNYLELYDKMIEEYLKQVDDFEELIGEDKDEYSLGKGRDGAQEKNLETVKEMADNEKYSDELVDILKFGVKIYCRESLIVAHYMDAGGEVHVGLNFETGKTFANFSDFLFNSYLPELAEKTYSKRIAEDYISVSSIIVNTLMLGERDVLTEPDLRDLEDGLEMNIG